MVKPYEEEQSKRLNERESTTLLTIFFRYIQDTYKQFKWQASYGLYSVTGYGKGYTTADITEKHGQVFYKTGSIFFYVDMREEGIVEVRSVLRKDRGEVGKTQKFPINGKSPKELGKLARNMFKWAKEKMNEY